MSPAECAMFSWGVMDDKWRRRTGIPVKIEVYGASSVEFANIGDGLARSIPGQTEWKAVAVEISDNEHSARLLETNHPWLLRRVMNMPHLVWC